MNFEDLAAKCKWRVWSRGESHCKACIGQPNITNCKEENCAPYHFGMSIANHFLLGKKPASMEKLIKSGILGHAISMDE